MKKLIILLKKLCLSVIIVFCVNLLVSNAGFNIPLNVFSIGSYYFLGVPGLVFYIVILFIT